MGEYSKQQTIMNFFLFFLENKISNFKWIASSEDILHEMSNSIF